MRRRDFLTLAGASAAAWPLAALAQQKVPRIAFLSIPISDTPYPKAFQDGLAAYGYLDGKTVSIEYFTAPTTADLTVFAIKAAATKPNVIVAYGTTAGLAAKAATSDIPIVFTNSSDPLTPGLVASLAHPGANVTGNTSLNHDFVGKQMSIVHETLPELREIAILNLPDVAPTAAQIPGEVAAAHEIGIESVVVDFFEGPDLATQFSQIMAARVQAALVTGSTYFQNSADGLYDLQIKNKMPLFGVNSLLLSASAQPAGLVNYGPSNVALVRQAGYFIDTIFHGVKPSDIPVQGPTVFDLAVNLKVANAIGITIPQSILIQATQVIS